MKASRSIELIIRDALEEAKKGIRANLRNTGTNASGKTSNSLRVEVSGCKGELIGRQAFWTVEKGRKGGRVPFGFRDIIYKWMQDKGVHATLTGRRSQRSADLSMAYLIARKIKNEGSSLFRNGRRNDIYSNVLPTTISKIKSETADMYSVIIKNIIR